MKNIPSLSGGNFFSMSQVPAWLTLVVEIYPMYCTLAAVPDTSKWDSFKLVMSYVRRYEGSYS